MPIFDPAIFDPAIFDSESEPPDPPAETTATLLIEWDGAEIGGIEWNASGQELLAGIDTATFTAQDRDPDSTWEPQPYTSVVIKVRASGWVLFRGESLMPRLNLPNGFPWRRWIIPCRGYWSAVDERLVGAPAGGIFVQPDPVNDPEYHYPVDPNASITGGTDAEAIENLVEAYLLLPSGVPIDTTTHVNEYIDSTILSDPRFTIDEQDGMTTLHGIVDQLAALADVNVQDWICPGGFDDDPVHWHHAEIPEWEALIGEEDPEHLEQSPYALWDRIYGPDGEAQIGHAGIDIEYDGQTMPEQLYGQGATTFVYNGGAVTTGGSGWYPDVNPTKSKRQAYYPIPDAWEQTRRDTVLAGAMLRAVRPALRGTVNVIGWRDPVTLELEARDGFRAGMLQYIRDPRLPFTLSEAGRFVIQSIDWSLVPGTSVVRYTLGFGDGPPLRASQRRVNEVVEAPVGPAAQKPMSKFVLDSASLGDIAAGESRELVFWPNDRFEEERPYTRGMAVSFVVVAYDQDANVVPGEGSFDPATTTVGEDLSVRTTFTAGDVEGLEYDVFVEADIA